MCKVSSGDMCNLIPGTQYCVSTMRLQPCFLAWLGQKLLNLLTQTNNPVWQVTQQVCSLWTWSRKCVSEFLMNTGVLSCCLSECQQFLWRTWMGRAQCTQHWLVNVLTQNSSVAIKCCNMLNSQLMLTCFIQWLALVQRSNPPLFLCFQASQGFWWAQQDFLCAWPDLRSWCFTLHLSARVTSSRCLVWATAAGRPPRNRPAKVCVLLPCRAYPSCASCTLNWQYFLFLAGKTPEEVVKRYLQKVRNPPEEVSACHSWLLMTPHTNTSQWNTSQWIRFFWSEQVLWLLLRTAPSAWRPWLDHQATKALVWGAYRGLSLWAAWLSVDTSTTSSAWLPCTTMAIRTAASSAPPARPSTEWRPAISLQARWSTTSSPTLCQDIPTAKPSASSTTSLLASRYLYIP